MKTIQAPFSAGKRRNEMFKRIWDAWQMMTFLSRSVKMALRMFYEAGNFIWLINIISNYDAMDINDPLYKKS